MPSPADSPAFAHGLALYEQGAYWDAHEAWESLWRDDRDAAWSDFVQALIQVAAAFHKLYKQQRASNAARILDRAIARLEQYPSPYFEIDLAALRTALRASAQRVGALTDGAHAEPGLAPRITAARTPPTS